MKVLNGIRSRVRRRWIRFLIWHSGPSAFGKIAARLAAWNTEPYHGRAFLADYCECGFACSSAHLAHPEMILGKHVYLGDRVVVSYRPDGGPVEFQDRVRIYGDTYIQSGWGGSIVIGTNTHVQPRCLFVANISDIRVGCSVEIAANCAFYSYNHGISPGQLIMDEPLTSNGHIVVEDGAWLGHGVTVLNGVRIGRGAVVGAGSVVVRDIPANAIAAGIPAKVIRYRDGTLPSA